MPSSDEYPLVSILIPAYNCAAVVEQTLESALAQTWPNTEVIVFDDGSTDDTLKVLQRFAGRITIDSGSNGGQNVTRNRLLRMSSGQWLQYLDADDLLAPDKVAQQMAMRDRGPLLFARCRRQYLRGDEVLHETDENPPPPGTDPWVAFFHWMYPNTTSWLWSRAAIEAAGGWNEHIKNCTDYDLIGRIMLDSSAVVACPDAWATYRMWNSGQATREAPLRLAKTRVQLMRELAEQLAAREELTPERRDAWRYEWFMMVRAMHRLDRHSAAESLVAWRQAFPGSLPNGPGVSASYRSVYRTLGFAAAEHIAKATRWLRKTPDDLTSA